MSDGLGCLIDTQNQKKNLNDIMEPLKVGEDGILPQDLGNDRGKLAFSSIQLPL